MADNRKCGTCIKFENCNKRWENNDIAHISKCCSCTNWVDSHGNTYYSWTKTFAGKWNYICERHYGHPIRDWVVSAFWYGLFMILIVSAVYELILI